MKEDKITINYVYKLDEFLDDLKLALKNIKEVKTNTELLNELIKDRNEFKSLHDANLKDLEKYDEQQRVLEHRIDKMNEVIKEISESDVMRYVLSLFMESIGMVNPRCESLKERIDNGETVIKYHHE